jgi:hypothetical protein
MSETALIDFSSMEAPTITSEAAPPEPPAAEPVEPTPQAEQPEREVTSPEEPPKPAAMKDIRTAVNAFAESNPEMGKLLKGILNNEGRYRAYSEIGDVDSLKSLKAAVDAAGGLEGLTKQSELQQFVDRVNAQWDEGDPEGLEPLFENGSDGPVKMFPHYMNRVEKSNPEAFGNAIRPHLVRSLESANFAGTVTALLENIEALGDKADPGVVRALKTSAQSMYQWFANEKRNGERNNLDALAPEREKLNKERGEVEQGKFKLFQSEVNSVIVPHMNSEFGTHMKPYGAALAALPEPMQQAIAQAWLKEIGAAFGKEYHANMESMLKAKGRDRTAIANYAKTRISAVAAKVSEKIAKDYKLAPGTATAKPKAGQKENEPPPPGAGSHPNNPIRVKDRPADNDIDWNADPDRINFIAGRAKLLHGSKSWVKWR